MCAECVNAVRETFPDVPYEEIPRFLIGTTCFMAGSVEQVKAHLLRNRALMTTGDYRECYAIADRAIEQAMNEEQP